jgi:hypothetical protein
LQQAGTVDLGEIALAYWDPVRRAYATARVDLGKVVVNPAERTVESDAEVGDRLATVVQPRTVLGDAVHRPLRWGDRPWFWLVLALGPLAVVGSAGASRLGSRLGQRWRARRDSFATRVSKALAEAETAARDGSAAAAATAGERALFLAVEAATGVKARGVLRGELSAKLQETGIPLELVEQITELLDSFDAVRFTGTSELAPKALVGRTGDLVRRVRRVQRRRPS